MTKLHRISTAHLDFVIGGVTSSRSNTTDITNQLQGLTSSLSSLPSRSPSPSSSNTGPQCMDGSTPVQSGWFGKQGGTPGVDLFHGPHCSSSSVPDPS